MTNNKEHSEVNKTRWDSLAEDHYEWTRVDESVSDDEYFNSRLFKSGESSLFPIELKELPNVQGKRVLHLQCHFGMDSLSLARMGAEVVGMDYSSVAIEKAKQLSKEIDVSATFVCSDVYNLPNVMADGKESFDLVFTSHGVLTWLYDLKAWAEVIAYFLKSGGQFYIIDGHPFSKIFDNEDDVSEFKPIIPYFSEGKSFRYENDGSYADTERNENSDSEKLISYEWHHTISDIIMALINAGLTIEFFHEHKGSSWKAYPFATMNDDRLWEVELDGVNLPLTYSILARKV